MLMATLRKYKLYLFSQDPYCTYYGIRLKLSESNCSNLDSNDATLDHVVSKHYNDPKTGKHNLALCCLKCNKTKKAKPIADFLNSKYLVSKRKLNCQEKYFYGY